MMSGKTHFDSEVRKLVMKKNGGEVTNDLFWSITAALGEDVSALINKVAASDEAGVERHNETLDIIRNHVAADDQYRKDQAVECAETHRKLFARAPRRLTDDADAQFAQMGRDMADPPDSQFNEVRESAHPDAFTPDQQKTLLSLITNMTRARKLVLAIGSILLTLVVGWLFAYSVAFFAADRAEKQGIEIERTALPAPIVTVTASPSP